MAAYREKELGDACPAMLALALSARKNLCIHPEVSLSLSNIQYVCMKTHRESENYLRGQVSTKRVGMMVDSACRDRTASWVRQQAQDGVDIELCDWFEVLFTRR